jgi:hypothetical protein
MYKQLAPSLYVSDTKIIYKAMTYDLTNIKSWKITRKLEIWQIFFMHGFTGLCTSTFMNFFYSKVGYEWATAIPAILLSACTFAALAFWLISVLFKKSFAIQIKLAKRFRPELIGKFGTKAETEAAMNEIFRQLPYRTL